jgi:hypothetical protein
MAARQPPKLNAAVQVRPPLPPLPLSIERAQDIPDDYIKANYVLGEYRKKRKKCTYIPLIRRLVEFLAEQGGTGEVTDGGMLMSVETLKNAFTQVFPSQHSYYLYPRVKVVSDNYASDIDLGEEGLETIGLHEVLLWREEAVYETDAKVIKRLKIKAFREAPREKPVKIAKKKKVVKKAR